MAFASIFIPNLMLQAVVRSEPGLRDRAVAIIEGAAPVWSVVAFNRAAGNAGIALGMTKSQVQQFLGIEIRPRSPAQEKAAHAALLDLGWLLSPRVEDTAPDAIVLDLAGLNSLLGSDETIAKQLAESASSLGLLAQIAVASKIEAAIIAARGFPGITLIPEGAEAEILGQLPASALSPSLETLETLERWGVRTCAALAGLPVLQLSERLGQEGVRLHELAAGKSERAMVLAEPALHFEEEMELEDAVEELEPLSFLLARLLGQLCARLEARCLAVCAIHARFELDPAFEADCVQKQSKNEPQSAGRKTGEREANHSPQRRRERREKTRNDPHGVSSMVEIGASRPGKSYERVLALPVAMRDAKTLLNLLRLHLQGDPPTAPIVKIALTADAARPRVAQGGLFLPSSPDPEKLELTLARLAHVVGDANVGSPELLDTHRPGEFRMRRFVSGAGELRRRRRPKVQDNGSLEQGVSRPSGTTTAEQTKRTPASVSVKTKSRSLTPIRENHAAGFGMTERDAELEKGNSGSLTVCQADLALVPINEGGTGFSSTSRRASGMTGEARTARTGFRVFRPAVPARVELRDRCPVHVRFEGLDGLVVAASGPWRSSGDWWREDGWQNDEWDLEIVFSSTIDSRSNGELRTGVFPESKLLEMINPNDKKKAQRGFYRIFFDAIRKEWFVRGAYD